jgi:hypothetical protein
LPENVKDVPNYLTSRLNKAYDNFLALLPENTYASINQDGWLLSADPTEKLSLVKKQKLADLKKWLTDHLREVKLPALLIEVDNDLHFSGQFMIPEQQSR